MSIFKNEYLSVLLKEREEAKAPNRSQNVEQAARALGRPDKINEEIWEQLTAPQRVSRFLGGFRNEILSGRYDEALSDLDYMRMANPDLRVTAKAAEVTSALLGCSTGSEVNPTVNSVVRYIAKRVSEELPIEIVISHCLAKDPAIRPAKLDYFLKGTVEDRDIDRFSTTVEVKGWERIEELLAKTRYPVQVTILLGDMDYLTLDHCGAWCSSRSLDRLKSEMAERRAEVADRADRYFGHRVVNVGLWSERYDLSLYQQIFREARDMNSWCERDALIGATEKVYFDQWGYRELSRQMGISMAEMKNFILGDLTRTAAQYRLEADRIGGEALIGWAETVPDRKWPLRVTNFNGAGYPPSIFLV